MAKMKTFITLTPGQVEEGWRQDGWAEVAQEDAGGDEVVAEVRLAHMLEELPDLVEAALELDGEVGVALGDPTPDL